MTDYLLWSTSLEPNYCSVLGVRNVPRAFEFQLGISRAEGFPPDACFEMDPKNKKGVFVPDNVYNLGQLVLVSRKLKELIEKANPMQTEYLKVRILDHKGKVASDEYFIVNQVGLQDCIDLKRSEIKWNAINPEKITSCRKLVLAQDRIDARATLFRPKYFPQKVLVHRPLAERLAATRATGLAFEEYENQIL